MIRRVCFSGPFGDSVNIPPRGGMVRARSSAWRRLSHRAVSRCSRSASGSEVKRPAVSWRKAAIGTASETRGNALWQAAQPSLENIARVMEQTLGRAAGFNPNTTHVLLTALTLAVIICAERIRSAMFEAAKKHGDRMERIGR